jgi:acyl-homoserine-lactone acylase
MRIRAIYAQAEDDFDASSATILTGLGCWRKPRVAFTAIFAEIIHQPRVQEVPDRPPLRPFKSMKQLMDGWAAGLNFYLATHPSVRPKVLTRFESWMALSFTEGSIGGDIESIDLVKLQKFYAPQDQENSRPARSSAVAGPALTAFAEPPPGGSNGFAIAPSRSASGHALLWINPHTSYYFRSELQMVSEQGLNVYGAVTWGQFFVYQGFNARNGWMHTSYGGDAIDEYAETIVEKPDGLYYRYGNGLKKLRVSQVAIPYKLGAGLGSRQFTVYHSHHGPIIRAEHDRWIAIKLLQDPVPALEQSYLRTKTADYAAFRKTQEMRTDTSNNTVYADADGTIAYFHGNFIPKRDRKFDYTRPVDGSNPATEWRGPLALEDTITLRNPSTGWIQNTNNWPFSAAGAASSAKTTGLTPGSRARIRAGFTPSRYCRISKA